MGKNTLTHQNTEIHNPLVKLTSFTDEDDIYFIIKPENSLKDVLRYVLDSLGDAHEFLYIATEVFNESKDKQ